MARQEQKHVSALSCSTLNFSDFNFWVVWERVLSCAPVIVFIY